MYFSSGEKFFGSRDSLYSFSQKIRSSMSAVNNSIHAWYAVKSTDKNENWVNVWYGEKDTYKNGKTDSTEYQETWRLNDNGKVDLLYQYAMSTKPPKH